MKIGLFGGTFNPIHYGHLFIAEWIRESLSLEKIIFIPAAFPPHKLDINITDKTHRWNMLKLATEDNPLFDISDIEIKDNKISYTVDTLKKFSKSGDEIYFIIGEDNLKELHIWKDPDKILSLSKIVIASRKKNSEQNKNHINNSKIIYANSPVISISSTQVRERVAQGKSIKYFVHPAVEEYISKEGLYR